MNSITRTLLAGAFVIAAGSAANAADLRVPPLMGGMKDYGGAVAVPAPMPIAEYSQWYIRGDLGYGFNTNPDMYEPDLYLPGVHHKFGDVDIDNQFAIGGGVGYYVNRHLRLDLTMDYRFRGGVQGTLNDNHAYSDNPAYDPLLPPGPANPQIIYSPVDLVDPTILISGIYVEDGGVPVKTHLAGRYNFDVQTTLFLANAYYDLRGRDGFTPYVGVGLGFAVHKFSDGRVNIAWDNCCGNEGGIEDETDVTFAAAAMAGFSYKMRDRWTLDAGYRFTWMGETQTGLSYTTTPDPTIAAGGLITNADPIVENLFTHDLRIGVRYDLN